MLTVAPFRQMRYDDDSPHTSGSFGVRSRTPRATMDGLPAHAIKKMSEGFVDSKSTVRSKLNGNPTAQDVLECRFVTSRL